jgi:hypothetical protein
MSAWPRNPTRCAQDGSVTTATLGWQRPDGLDSAVPCGRFDGDDFQSDATASAVQAFLGSLTDVDGRQLWFHGCDRTRVESVVVRGMFRNLTQTDVERPVRGSPYCNDFGAGAQNWYSFYLQNNWVGAVKHAAGKAPGAAYFAVLVCVLIVSRPPACPAAACWTCM